MISSERPNFVILCHFTVRVKRHIGLDGQQKYIPYHWLLFDRDFYHV